jgi:CheY-like chemotaxis protein
MSHELRTPVAAILGNVELLLTDPHMDEEARRARLEAIQSNAEHQVALISDVLELSKIEANSMELDRQPTRLGRVAREALALVEIKAREKGIELRLEGEDALPALATDALRVRQILVNLLANAIRFTDEGGVTVELAGDVDHGVVRARVTVRDTGRGMTTEQLGRIFDAYRQAEVSMERNRGGTGLGLAISHELAARLGGDLVATSEPGAGSAFVLTLAGPLASEVPPPLPQASMEDLGAAIAGTRILLAEDQRDLALVVRRQLELAGCTVVHAADGHAAVEAFAEQEPDLVLLDLQMPRMGGLEAARRIRAGGWTGPIVALTANAALEEREACLRDAFDDFATKPLRRRSLLEVVERNVRGAERA